MLARFLTLVSLAVLGLVLAACAGASSGGPAGAPTAGAPEVVQVTLTDFKVTPSKTEFVRGKPYRFVIKNSGSVAHEWVVAPRGASDDSKFLTEVEEDELPVGATEEHDYTFTQAGDFEMSCHVPGHYESGMVVPITVK